MLNIACYSCSLYPSSAMPIAMRFLTHSAKDEHTKKLPLSFWTNLSYFGNNSYSTLKEMNICPLTALTFTVVQCIVVC